MAVNLNTAGYEELMTIPGVGEKRATGILALREKGVHVNYEVVEEIWTGKIWWPRPELLLGISSPTWRLGRREFPSRRMS